MPSNSHNDQNSKKILDQTNNFSEKTCSRAECKMERRRRGKTNKSKLSGPFISADLVRRMQTIAEGTGAGKDAIPVKMKFTQPRSRNHSSVSRSNGQWRERRTGVEISTFYRTGRRERASSTGKLVSPVSISRVPDSWRPREILSGRGQTCRQARASVILSFFIRNK